MEFQEALRILAAFHRHGVEYVLVGSMAMAAQGLIRATRDVDFFVRPDRRNIDRLKEALRDLFGDDPNIDDIHFEDLSGEYPAVEYTPPGQLYSLDILARLGVKYGYGDLESEELVVEGVPIRVATPRMLYRMKRGTVRSVDRLDAEAIRRRFEITEGE